VWRPFTAPFHGHVHLWSTRGNFCRRKGVRILARRWPLPWNLVGLREESSLALRAFAEERRHGSAPPCSFEHTCSAAVPVTAHPARSDYPVVRLDSAGGFYLIAWADARRNSDAWYDVYYRSLAV